MFCVDIVVGIVAVLATAYALVQARNALTREAGR